MNTVTPTPARPSPPGESVLPGQRPALGRLEFIVLVASLMALNALSIDIMLPGLQQIGASLGVVDENQRQFVLSAYIVGFGGAQLVFGPMADRFGRRTPLIAGLVIYVASAAACAFAPSFAALLLLRFTQGIGAAATRVMAVTLVRDLYGGRRMAEIMSMVMMVFMTVPVIAPSVGQVIMIFGEWPMIFLFIALTGAVVGLWVILRLPETLKPENRRDLTFAKIGEGFRIVLTNRIALCYALATASIFGAMFGFLNSAQQIFVDIYGLGVLFPVLFAAVASMMAVSSFLNARIVGRIGMRRLSHGALIAFLSVCLVWLLTSLIMPLPLWLFVAFFAAAMFPFGWIGANFNAMAMEPLADVAGTASSVIGFMQTAGGGLIGAFIGQAYDGTTVPLITGFFTVSALGLAFVLIGERGRLFSSSD